MDNKLTPFAFFRAFDLAFFVPGVVILLSVEYSLRETGSDSLFEMISMKGIVGQNQSYLRSICLGISTLVCVYVCGLICHSVTWLLVRLRRSYDRVKTDEVKGLDQYLSEFLGDTAVSENSGLDEIENFAAKVKSVLEDNAKERKREFIANRLELIKELQVRIRPNTGSNFVYRIFNSLLKWFWSPYLFVKNARRRNSVRELIEAVKFPDSSLAHVSNSEWTNDKNLISDYVSYFWYLRSTCWNLTTALLFAALYNFFMSGGNSYGVWIVSKPIIVLLVAVLFLLMGNAYDRSYNQRKLLVRRICKHEEKTE